MNRIYLIDDFREHKTRSRRSQVQLVVLLLIVLALLGAGPLAGSLGVLYRTLETSVLGIAPD